MFDSGSLLRRGADVIARALRNAPRHFAVGGGGALLFAAATIGTAAVLGEVTDRVILPSFDAGRVDVGLTALAGGAVLGVGALKAAGVVGRRWGAYLAQYGLQATFRRRVTRRYLQLPLTWHRRHTTGELLSNANSDVENAFFIAAPLPMALAAIVMLVGTAVLLLVTDPFLAAIGFAVGPALALANYLYQRRMRAAATLAQQGRAVVSEIAHESFDAAIVVKTMGREASETTRFRGLSDDLRDKLIRVGRLRGAFDPVLEALPNIAILLVLLLGAYRVRDGALTAGDLIEFAYLFQLIALPMRVFGWLLGQLPQAVVGLDRVDSVLTATGDMPYGQGSGSGAGGARAQLEHVAYHYPASARDDLSDLARPAAAAARAADASDGTTRGIADVSFTVDAGHTIAIVGATGSGKTTVSALLVRLFDPDRGEIRFDGQDLRALARPELARHVAIVFQEAFLFDDTVRENITLGGDFSDDDVEQAARIARADGFVAALDHGYDTVVGERGSSLSGGQRQRIALARALVRRPRLLVLDDATSAVDPAVEAEILTGLADADIPATVLVVAYRRSSIALADEVVFVEDGRIRARGPHDRLLAEVPAYARLVTAYEHEDERRYVVEDAEAAS